MKGKKVLVKETIKGKTKTELIALNGIFTLDKCIKTIDKIVNKTKSRYELENERTIEKLITDNENLLKQQEIFEQKIILLERENTKRNE
jgi:mevalonate kinase